MFAEERQQQIAGLVAASGRASVTDLAERFRITTETVRRDLAALESAGSVRRVHGGAVSADRFSTTEESILSGPPAPGRSTASPRLPSRSCRRAPRAASSWTPAQPPRSWPTSWPAAVPYRPSTTEPDRIRNWWSSRTRFPSPPNSPVRRASHCRSWAAGSGTDPGRRWPGNRGRRPEAPPGHRLRGNQRHPRQLWPQHPRSEEAAVKAAFVQSARRIVVLADSSKLDAETLVQFASVEDLDTVITDRKPSPELAAALADAGVELVIA